MPRRVLAAIIATLLGLSAGRAAELDYMKLFTAEEKEKAHVAAQSHALPQDFVDGQWQGIIAASDGRTYFSVSSHSPKHNAQFYRYDAEKDAVEHLIDVGVWCGYEDSPGNYNAQGKIHSNIFEHEGRLYCTTTSAHATLDHPYPGGHFLAYDLETGEFLNLGKVDYEGKGGLLSAVLDPKRERMYAIHQHETMLLYMDLNTREIVEVGPIEDGGMQCRWPIVDGRGILYGSTRDGMIYRYNPRTETRGCLLTRVPHDPNAPQPEPGDGLAWRTTHWDAMVWDEKTEWWYGVRGNDEYLFRFRPPEDPRSHIGRAEGLIQIGYRPSKIQPRFASLGLARKGRTLYYCSYPIWRSQAHLVSYNIDTGRAVDHGPIIVEGDRRVSEIHSMVVGSDGSLHTVGMVWSKKGEDPANPWANRAQCYFHARFVRIDPEAHFHHQDDARRWQREPTEGDEEGR